LKDLTSIVIDEQTEKFNRVINDDTVLMVEVPSAKKLWKKLWGGTGIESRLGIVWNNYISSVGIARRCGVTALGLTLWLWRSAACSNAILLPILVRDTRTLYSESPLVSSQRQKYGTRTTRLSSRRRWARGYCRSRCIS